MQISAQVVIGGTVLLGMLGTGTGVTAGSVVTGHPGCSVGLTGVSVGITGSQVHSGVGVFSLGGTEGYMVGITVSVGTGQPEGVFSLGGKVVGAAVSVGTGQPEGVFSLGGNVVGAIVSVGTGHPLGVFSLGGRVVGTSVGI